MIARHVRMLLFHTKLFAGNTYFFQLLITSTITMLLLQGLGSLGHGGELPPEAWLRAGMVGTWTVCAVSTGLIGFQRFQGTLVYLVSAPIGARSALLPVVGAAGTFGLLAFPLAYVTGVVLGFPHDFSGMSLVAGILAFWVASVVMSLVIAAAFTRSPNALVYESVVATPIILLSGVFGFSPDYSPLAVVLRVLPLTNTVSALTREQGDSAVAVDLVLTAFTSVLWLCVAAIIARTAVNQATRRGTLELV